MVNYQHFRWTAFYQNVFSSAKNVWKNNVITNETLTINC